MTVIAGALALGAARAGEVPSFSSLDADGNGRVSADEASSHRGLRELMPEYDRDGDGRLGPSEYTALLEDAAREARQVSAGGPRAAGTKAGDTPEG